MFAEWGNEVFIPSDTIKTTRNVMKGANESSLSPLFKKVSRFRGGLETPGEIDDWPGTVVELDFFPLEKMITSLRKTFLAYGDGGVVSGMPLRAGFSRVRMPVFALSKGVNDVRARR